MRARNLKPGLFKNEKLGSADPLLTILFEGLWCMADREGRLEDRPLRICAEVFPYRRAVNEKKADSMLDWLQTQEFIARYEVGGERFIQVLAFTRHNSPHPRERPSEIPVLTVVRPIARLAPESGEARKRHDTAHLNPESGILNPESSLRERAREQTSSTSPNPREGNGDESPQSVVGGVDQELFEAFTAVKENYPHKSGRLDWITAEHHWRRRLEEGSSVDELLAGVKRYFRFVVEGGVSGDRYVLGPEKFFSAADKPWAQEWRPPAAKGDGAPAWQDEFMRRTAEAPT